MRWDLAIIAFPVLCVVEVSRRLTDRPVTPAMAFVLVGLVAGPLVTHGITISPVGATVHRLAEAALAVVLFTDASRIKLRVLRHEYSVPLRLLGVGLPLTIALGAGLAALLFTHLTIIEAVVLAVVLAPTDAGLGQSIVTERRLPSRIRQGLNVESGLNDGICVPLLLIALSGAEVESAVTSGHHALSIVAQEIGYGALGGAAAGVVAAAVIKIADRRDLITDAWLQVIPVAGAALAYGIATALHGSGFIAAFLAGTLFGTVVSSEAEEASRFSEEVGGLLAGITFLIFGAVLLGPALEHLSWQVALYSVLSLTVVRMLPVALAMVGTGARPQTVSFLGWFGPRGLASIVFAAIVVSESHLPGIATIVRATYVTIGLSVIAHGISAAPLAHVYARWYRSKPRTPAMESVPSQGQRHRGSRSEHPAAPTATTAS